MNIKKKTVKKIFLFFLFYLPFQYMLVGVVGVLHSEPWPAFVLPGFKSVYAAEEHVEITEPKFFAQPVEVEHPIEVKPAELFKGIPTSQLQGFLRSNFSNQTEFTVETKNWLQEQLKRLFPGKDFEGLTVKWVPVIYYTRGGEVHTATKESTKIINVLF